MGEPLVLWENRGPIVVLTLNRPAARNALSRALVLALSDCLSALARDTSVRALVLTANGRSFCSGMDLKEAAADIEHAGTSEAETQAVRDTRAIADLINSIHALPCYTVAAVQGDALAGGAGLAMACDAVVMADSARLGYPEVLRGLVAAIVLQDLVHLAGARRARHLLLTGRLIQASDALSYGLINHVSTADQLRDDALTLAHASLAAAPQALATTKKLLDEAARRPANLHGPAAVSAAVRVGDEAAEGLRAFLEKRPPAWTSSQGVSSSS
jgi:methylglutaconyl-CoA hydratase